MQLNGSTPVLSRYWTEIDWGCNSSPGYPTEPGTILEPQDQEIGEFDVIQERRGPVFETLFLPKDLRVLESMTHTISELCLKIKKSLSQHFSALEKKLFHGWSSLTREIQVGPSYQVGRTVSTLTSSLTTYLMLYPHSLFVCKHDRTIQNFKFLSICPKTILNYIKFDFQGFAIEECSVRYRVALYFFGLVIIIIMYGYAFVRVFITFQPPRGN